MVKVVPRRLSAVASCVTTQNLLLRVTSFEIDRHVCRTSWRNLFPVRLISNDNIGTRQNNATISMRSY